MKIPYKKIINLTIVAITISLAIYFFSRHQYLLTEISKIPLYLIFLVIFLYLLIAFILSLLFIETIKINKAKVKLFSSILVNSKSLFINFFVPGQSGPAYRAYYLKTEHKVKLVDYSFSLLLYYAIYFIISLSILLLGAIKLFYCIPLLLVFYLTSYFFLKYYLGKKNTKRYEIKFDYILTIFALTLLQSIVIFTIYYLELHFVSNTFKLQQILAYTGIANLSLFVALTPGAIGIREAFLIFSRNITHIDTAQVAATSLIDRSIYIVFLLILGLFLLINKSKGLGTKSPKEPLASSLDK